MAISCLYILRWLQQYNSCRQIGMEQVQPGSFTSQHYHKQISELCSEIAYFLIYPYQYNLKHTEPLQNIAPFLLTFRDDSTTFVEILNRYLKLNPSEKRNSKILTFTLPMGSFINRNMSVKMLKKQLRRDSLDGLNLYVIEEPQQQRKKGGNSEFDNECALMDFAHEECFDKKKEFLFHFLLPKSSYIVTITINPTRKVSQLMSQFVQHLSSNYRQALGQNKFAEIGAAAIQDYIVSDGTKYSKIANKDEVSIHESRYLYSGDMVSVIMRNQEFEFKKIVRSDFPITLIVKSDKPEVKSKILNIRYDEISDFTVSNLYWVYFLAPEERKAFEAETKQNRLCLKVLEYILSPDETLMSIDPVIQKVKTLGEFKLVVYFVTEKMVFYQNIPKIAEKYEFEVSHLQLEKSEKNQKIKQQIEYNSEKFLKDRFKELQQLTKQKHFEKPKEILPIVVYSSELLMVDEETNSKMVVYYCLNWQLRVKSILKAKAKDLERWYYKLASVLLKPLERIKSHTNKFYRGVTFLLDAKQKQRITFKNFLSTTTDPNVALRFALKGQIQKQAQNPAAQPAPLVLYNITAASGKSIENFSVFPNEKEYLFEPYSEFMITKIKEQQFEVKISNTAKSYPFTVYELEEVMTPKLMPQTINNYIVWVDDKPEEGTLIYNELISEFHYPTVLFQLRSTRDLLTWIQERSIIINDSSKKMIMITNMVRTEDGNKNYYAGVDAINLVNTAIIPNIPIVLYVGDLKSAEKNMKEKGCNPSNVKMMNTYNELSQCVSQKIGVKFKRNNEENVQQVQPLASNGNSGNEGSFCQIM